MISFDEAYLTIMENAPALRSEWILLNESLKRILAEDVKADRDMPPFYKSAVDGYACVDPQDGEQLKVLEVIPAGSQPTKPVKPGTCSKLMTGAEIPENTNMVVMVENVEEKEGGFVKINRTGSKSNIAEKGEDFREGEIIVSRGSIIKPQHIAVMASVGKVQPLVSKRPRVSIITTGSELVEPEDKPAPGQIRNSNAVQLESQFQDIGIHSSYEGIVRDTGPAILKVLTESIENNHLTLVTGGVSMGDYDFVPEMIEKSGVDIFFHEIAMKPGKPTIFGKRENHLVIGLPGNPVSTFLQFELLIKPLLYRMMGTDYKPVEIKMPLGEDFRQRKSQRDSWKPVKVKGGKVYAVNYHGSGHIHALQEANGFICLPAGTEMFEKDTLVHVRQI
ncbi:MAG: gephyrin-like molybdotransferase Glp [Bacteroidota bacterium]